MKRTARPAWAWLTGVLLCVVALSAGVTQQASAAPPTFVDVSESNQFAFEIGWLAEQEISTGWQVNGQREYRALEPIARDAMGGIHVSAGRVS